MPKAPPAQSARPMSAALKACDDIRDARARPAPDGRKNDDDDDGPDHVVDEAGSDLDRWQQPGGGRRVADDVGVRRQAVGAGLEP